MRSMLDPRRKPVKDQDKGGNRYGYGTRHTGEGTRAKATYSCIFMPRRKRPKTRGVVGPASRERSEAGRADPMTRNSPIRGKIFSEEFNFSREAARLARPRGTLRGNMIRWIGFLFGIAGLVFAMELFGPNIEALRGSGAYIYFPIMRRWWRKEKEKKCCTGLHASSLTCHRLRWISLTLHGSPPA